MTWQLWVLVIVAAWILFSALLVICCCMNSSRLSRLDEPFKDPSEFMRSDE